MALQIGGATLSGKVGGTVYLVNGVVRAFAIPSNPNTTAQALMRARMSAYSTFFRGFTAQQQSDWADAALNFPRTNRVGDSYTLSGTNFFTSCIMIADLMQDFQGAVTLPNGTNPPTPQTATAILLKGVDADASAIKISMTGQVESDEYLMVFATAPLSPGITYTRQSRYKLIGVYAKADFVVDDVILTTAYIAQFGSTGALGQRIFVETYTVRNLEWVKRPAGKAFAVRS